MKNPNAGKYQSTEKVLYLAGQDKGLNVNKQEKQGSDLDNQRNVLLEHGFIKKSKETDRDNFYELTTKGRMKLLEYQIGTRRRLGKTTDMHELQLEELKRTNYLVEESL